MEKRSRRLLKLCNSLVSQQFRGLAQIETDEAETWHTPRFLCAETENINEKDISIDLLLKFSNQPRGTNHSRVPPQESTLLPL